MKIRHLLFFLLFPFFPFLFSQELNALVRVSAPSLATSDKSVVDQMEKAVKEFLNNQKWTTDVFEIDERIKCNFQITIGQDNGDNNFLIDIAIQATRPVYNASYETPLISILEKEIPIKFDPFRSLENSKEIFTDNFSAVLTFYAYLILFMDYESFSENGGEPYLIILNNMLNSLPSSAKSLDDNWSPTTKRKTNRFYLVENLTNPRMRFYRKGIYEYYRQGLDLMAKDPILGRQNLTNAILSIQGADNSYPQSFIMQLFATTKINEIIEIYKKGSPAEKQSVLKTMAQIDPSNSSKYESAFNQ